MRVTGRRPCRPQGLQQRYTTAGKSAGLIFDETVFVQQRRQPIVRQLLLLHIIQGAGAGCLSAEVGSQLRAQNDHRDAAMRGPPGRVRPGVDHSL